MFEPVRSVRKHADAIGMLSDRIRDPADEIGDPADRMREVADTIRKVADTFRKLADRISGCAAIAAGRRVLPSTFLGSFIKSFGYSGQPEEADYSRALIRYAFRCEAIR